MKIALTDVKRYALEKESIIALLLASARRGEEVTEKTLRSTLGIDNTTLTKLIEKLKAEGCITAT